MRNRSRWACGAASGALAVSVLFPQPRTALAQSGEAVPAKATFTKDTTPVLSSFDWGMVVAVAPDAEDHLWVLQRSDGQHIVPPIVELDKSRKFVKSFGDGLFHTPHGLFVDHDGHVWAVDSGPFSDRGRVSRLLRMFTGG